MEVPSASANHLRNDPVVGDRAGSRRGVARVFEKSGLCCRHRLVGETGRQAWTWSFQKSSTPRRWAAERSQGKENPSANACVRCLAPWPRGLARGCGPWPQSKRHVGEPLALNSVPGTWPGRACPVVSRAPRSPTQLASAASPRTWGCATKATERRPSPPSRRRRQHRVQHLTQRVIQHQVNFLHPRGDVRGHDQFHVGHSRARAAVAA